MEREVVWSLFFHVVMPLFCTSVRIPLVTLPWSGGFLFPCHFCSCFLWLLRLLRLLCFWSPRGRAGLPLPPLCCLVSALVAWTMYRSFTSSLLRSLNLQAAMYALLSLTLVCNMQLNVLDDLAEAMKALDGKKCVVLLLAFLFVLCGLLPLGVWWCWSLVPRDPPPDSTHCDDLTIESVFVMVKIDEAHYLRNLRWLWVLFPRLSFHLSSGSQHVSPFWFHFPIATWQCHCWHLDCVKCWPICEIVAVAARTLWSRGSWLGEALISALCCVASLAHRLWYGFFVILFCVVDVCHTNLMGDTMLSSSQYVSIPVYWPADHHRAVVVCCLVGFCLVSVFCVSLGSVVVFIGFLVALDGDSSALWIMYRPTQALFFVDCRPLH